VAMRKSKRQELRKLRELIRSLLEDVKCFLCKEVLLTEGWIHVGGCDGAPVSSQITIHHRNGDHDDNQKKNRTYVHTTCHKSYHMALLWKEKKISRKPGRRK